jgi:hypothetical protein
MQLSIIIVNWNSKDFLRECIASILAETRGLEYEIITIDSGSFDGCGQMLSDYCPQVRFIQSEQNLGFAKANNMAFKASTGDCVLFLNPDTELLGPAINLMYEHLRSSSNVGAVGCKLLNTDGTIQTSCIQSFPTILNQLLSAELIRHRFPRFRLWGMAPLFDESKTSSEVEAISGACLMMSRSVFERIGMFSTDYFMYSEDVDLCYKSWKAGFRNYYVPVATVVHHGGGSTQDKPSTFSNVMMLESRHRYFVKTRSKLYADLYRAQMALVSALRVALGSLFWIFGFSFRRRANAVSILRKWCSRLRWTLGLEQWVSKF